MCFAADIRRPTFLPLTNGATGQIRSSLRRRLCRQPGIGRPVHPAVLVRNSEFCRMEQESAAYPTSACSTWIRRDERARNPISSLRARMGNLSPRARKFRILSQERCTISISSNTRHTGFTRHRSGQLLPMTAEFTSRCPPLRKTTKVLGRTCSKGFRWKAACRPQPERRPAQPNRSAQQ